MDLFLETLKKKEKYKKFFKLEVRNFYFLKYKYFFQSWFFSFVSSESFFPEIKEKYEARKFNSRK